MCMQLLVFLYFEIDIEKSLAWDAGKTNIDRFWELMNHACDAILVLMMYGSS